jgi:hypothetical protein
MTRMATATIRSGIHAMTIVSAAFHSNLASNLICAFAAGRAAILCCASKASAWGAFVGRSQLCRDCRSHA